MVDVNYHILSPPSRGMGGIGVLPYISFRAIGRRVSVDPF
jgi:hypothetical protein